MTKFSKNRVRDPNRLDLGKTLRVCFKLANIGSKIGACPFEWNQKENTLLKTKSKIKLYAWYFLVGYFTCNSSFQLFRFFQAACCLNITYGRLFSNLLSIATLLVTTSFHYNTFFRMDELEEFANQLAKTNKYIEDHYSYPTEEENRNRGDWKSPAKKLSMTCFSYSLLQFFVAMRAWNNPKYLSSFLDLKGVAKWKLIPFGCLESFYSFNLAVHLLFNVTLNIAYTRNTTQCLTILKEKEIGPEERRLYRVFQLLNKLFNNWCKFIVQPGITVAALIVNILGMYATFKLYHEVPMPGYLGFPFVWVASGMVAKYSFPMSGAIHDISHEIIKKIYSKGRDSGEVKRFKKSCNNLDVKVRDIYAIHQHTTLTFFHTSMDNTVFLLLTF